MQDIYSKRRNEGHNWNSRAWSDSGASSTQDSPATNFNVSEFMIQKVHSKSRRTEFMTPQPVIVGSKQSSKRRHQSTESRGFDRAVRSKPQRRPRPKTPTADKRAKNVHEKRDSGWTQRQLLPKTFVMSIKALSTTSTHPSLLIF